MVKEIVARSRNSRKRRSTTASNNEMAGTGPSNGQERSHPTPGNRVSSYPNIPPDQPPAVPIGQRINSTREHNSDYLEKIENTTNLDGAVINQRGESEGIINNIRSDYNDGRQGQLLKGSGDGVMLPPNRQRNSSSTPSQQQRPPPTDQKGNDTEKQDSLSHDNLSSMRQDGGQSVQQELRSNHHAPISSEANSHHSMPRQDNSTQERFPNHLDMQENNKRSDQHQVGGQLTKSDQITGNQEQERKPLTTSSHDGSSNVANDQDSEHRPVYAKELKEWQNSWVKTNFVRLNIFFEDVTMEETEQISSYGLVDLWSDIGGILGLWAGISIITVIEFFSFAASLCAALFRRDKMKQLVGPI